MILNSVEPFSFTLVVAIPNFVSVLRSEASPDRVPCLDKKLTDGLPFAGVTPARAEEESIAKSLGSMLGVI